MLSISRRLDATALIAGLMLLAGCREQGFDGNTDFGGWRGSVRVDSQLWQPGQKIAIWANLQLTKGHFQRMAQAGHEVSSVVALITAERTFDADGWMRLPSDQGMSTLITPTGLAIEGGVSGAVTNRFGYDFKTPVDELVEIPVASLPAPWDMASALFEVKPTLPADLPPGLYRVRVDFGLKAMTEWGEQYVDLSASSFAYNHSAEAANYVYSSLIPASGKRPSGADVDATQIQPRIPWILLGDYNSNGYSGVVADEDRTRFALSPRNIIPDEVVLPLYWEGWDSKISYSLEPSFPADGINPRGKIDWDSTKGELTLEITAPDGTSSAPVTAPIAGRTSGGDLTTNDPRFTSWQPPSYGRYTVKLTGSIYDRAGRRYTGGGTYHFWIAKRMTMATATFQGMAYPVGYKYGRDIGFSPPVPATVQIEATLYPGSRYDPAPQYTAVSNGTATAGGVFGVPQGMVQLALSAPGEYHAKILATYQEPGEGGHLWVCVMRHAGVVYATDTPIVARGKKLYVNDAWVDRGATGREGSRGSLDHLGFPYSSGDVLLMASEGTGSNKIEPGLVVEDVGQPLDWGWPLAGIGTSNLTIRTSNGYSPHLFPEYITDMEYYYAAAARPGFVPRFIVGENQVFAPYWPTSPNGFGGQIAASYNGDLPGDIYRLIGGVAKVDKDKTAVYAGYLSSAFILPGGTNNNRVIAPGDEDLIGATGARARFFLVGFRPGMALPEGATWRPAVQVDPMVPAVITVNLSRVESDGSLTSVKSWTGTADAGGSWAGADATAALAAGVYRYTLSATWQGFEGKMPGLPDSGGEFYVFSASRPASGGLSLDLPGSSDFDPAGVLTVKGTSTASSVHYALIMPGAVLDQGVLPVTGGSFEYVVNPAVLHGRAPIYDIRDYYYGGDPYIGRVLHLSFSSQENPAGGTAYWDFRRVIVRGTTVLQAK
jgi:hypothetical protein